uniref:Titin n=1 Tax=Amphilophus citrinellus TaxID=61819 RepID=A0A3Q0QPL8_AMPCI
MLISGLKIIVKSLKFNDCGQDRQLFSVLYAEPPTITIDPEMKDGISVRAGDTIIISASKIVGKPPPTAIWSKKGRELKNSDIVTITSTPTSSTLAIKYASRKNTGEYTITASNPFGIKEEHVKVKVASLAWTKPLHDGGSLITGYVIEAQKKDTDQWVHVATIKALDYTVTDLIEGAEYTFRIIAVNASGRSDPRESRPAIIKEQTSAPSFDLRGVYQKTVIAKAGDRLKVEIPVLGKPRPVVSWKKGDTGLKETQRINIETTLTSTILNINEIKRTDGGQYSMTGKNMLGTVSETITVLVHDIPGPPTGPIKLEEVSYASYSSPVVVMAGEVFKLEASVTGRPIPSLVWTKEGKELEDTAKMEIKTSDFHTTLINKDSLRRDGGTFTLTASNPGGFAKFIYNVKVLDRPGPPDSLTVTDVTAEKSCSTLRLFVPIRGRPAPEVKWSREHGESLDKANIEITPSFTTLQVDNVDRYDGGKYTVTIENASGSKTAFVNVRVLDTPGAPQNLIVKEVTKDSVSLVWDSSWKVGDLEEGKMYFFRILAENEYGIGLPVETLEPIKVSERPLPPGKVSLREVTSKSVTLTWEKPDHDGGSRITGYAVEMQGRGSEMWTQVMRNVSELRFRVTGLLENHSYEFRVAAENAAGVGMPSVPTVYYKALDPVFKPGPPNNPKVVDTSRSTVSLTWGKPIYDGGCEVQAYIVEACNGASDEWFMCTPPTGIVNTKFTVTKLLEKHEYQFRVCAINKVGIGEHADVPGKILLEEKLEAPDLELDADMRKMINIRAASTLRLFVPVRGRPAPEVKWGKADGEIKETAQIDNTSSYASLVIENVDRFDSGKYTLTAENASGIKSVFISVRVLDSPGPPANFMVKEITKNSVTLTWEPPQLDGGSKIKQYIVEKRESTRKVYSPITTCNKMSWKVEPLPEGGIFFFRVLAENEYGVGLPAKTIEPVKISEKPQPPGKVSVVDVTHSTVTLTWEKPQHDGGSRITHYEVELAPKDSEAWSVCASVKALETIVTNLLKGEEYQFRVVAVNDKGKSDPRQLAHSVVAKDLVIEPAVRPKVSSYKRGFIKENNFIPVLSSPIPILYARFHLSLIFLLERSGFFAVLLDIRPPTIVFVSLHVQMHSHLRAAIPEKVLHW